VLGLPYLLGGGGFFAMLVFLAHQLRLHLRDSADRNLARHMFDQARSTQALDGYTKMIKARRELPLRRKTPERHKSPT
jgi:hypothetical protein